MDDLAERLRQIREQMGLTQAELAKRARLRHQSTIGNLENRCPGYIVDHIIPLCMGGPDVPKNMQWQTKPASLVKDKFERDACRFLQKNRARQSITKNC